jgi:hypothetical protein
MLVHQRAARAHRPIAGHEIDGTGPGAGAPTRHAFADGERTDVGERSVHLSEFQVFRCGEPVAAGRPDWIMRCEAHELLGRWIPEWP